MFQERKYFPWKKENSSYQIDFIPTENINRSSCKTPYICAESKHNHCMVFMCNKKLCDINFNICSFHCESELHKHCKELNCESELMCSRSNTNICSFHCEKKDHNHCPEYKCNSMDENCKFHRHNFTQKNKVF